jgi:hypothetical protein
VIHEERGAECIVGIDHALLDRIIRGEANANARWLRNEFVLEGKLTMLDYLKRVFPDPPRSHNAPPMTAGTGGRRR